MAAPVVEAPVVEEPEPPPPPEPTVQVEADTIELKAKVEFETGSAELTEGSKPLLDQVAQVMKDHPEITKVRIDGHTDSTSTRSFNQKLSTQRAAAVKDYLITRGVEAERLTSKGFGQDKPIADNATDLGRATNRRVEIHILERK